jgi:hypothetical protein
MRLVAVLANPPMSDHGTRTRARVDLAADIIGCDTVTIVNLFPVPSRSSLDIAALGETSTTWLAARPEINEAVTGADAVLLGYGTSPPAGRAGDHHRAQVSWTRTLLESLSTQPWMVGGLPRHPSRWQRHTSRTFPGRSFVDALSMVLGQRQHALEETAMATPGRTNP